MRRALVASLLAGLGVVATACSTGGGTSNPAHLDGSQNFYYGSAAVVKGQTADFTAVLEVPKGEHVTLTAATLLPVRHLPSPSLRHVYLEGIDFSGAQDGYPPSGVDVQPLAGHTLGPGQTNIGYAVASDRVGYYYDNGLRLTYRYRGQSGRVDIYGPGLACVLSNETALCSKRATATQLATLPHT